MRMLWTGLAGWMKMADGRNEAKRLVDGSITVVATMLVVLTWTMLR